MALNIKALAPSPEHPEVSSPELDDISVSYETAPEHEDPESPMRYVYSLRKGHRDPDEAKVSFTKRWLDIL